MKKVTEDMTENQILYALLQKKVGATDPYKVLSIRRGSPTEPFQYHLGGKKLPVQQAMNLRSEAQLIKSTGLYKFITETLRHEAHRAMFEDMKTMEDQHYGKALLHSITMIEQIVTLFSEIIEQKK